MTVYKEIGQGAVWIEGKDQEKAVEKIADRREDEENFGSYDIGSFKTEEIYVDDYSDPPQLSISGSIEELYISLGIPLTNKKALKELISDLIKTL